MVAACLEAETKLSEKRKNSLKQVETVVESRTDTQSQSVENIIESILKDFNEQSEAMAQMQTQMNSFQKELTRKNQKHADKVRELDAYIKDQQIKLNKANFKSNRKDEPQRSTEESKKTTVTTSEPIILQTMDISQPEKECVAELPLVEEQKIDKCIVCDSSEPTMKKRRQGNSEIHSRQQVNDKTKTGNEQIQVLGAQKSNHNSQSDQSYSSVEDEDSFSSIL